ncbi:zinc ABC transporter solute-binding protein [Azoarcus sp. TTM-91]|uniref:metal ABC transporter solute-binding protein, Zn/Mn family n=1 Tax=Azoarcus sp. TTM-91 TaxID=2691581 RepID=UPI00145E6085|nr:zinc ABC transporter substrate-binding protein [Azoarcus sp. TTM-91]NMG34363.1 zinc ABC transporter solute-binding protein [Azoarcus sp. TTM-91]
MLRLWCCVLFCLSLLAPACRAAPPLEVVTTLAQIAEPLGWIAGPRARVSSLLGAGVDPHLYRPTRSDVARLAAADLVFYNGLHLEAQMEGMLQALAARKPVVALADGVEPARLRGAGASPAAAARDPHLWMDPALWRSALEHAVAALIAADPAGAEGYRSRARAYFLRLQRLQAYVTQVMATVPAQSRVLVTAHDAFGYFGRAFDLEVLAIQGLSTESEAGLRRIEELVEVLVSRRIAAVFVESSVSPRSVQALIDGAAARGHRVRIGGELYSDAMGPPGDYTGSYLGMLDHNASTIARALGGRVPAGGLRGELAEMAGAAPAAAAR